MLAGGRSTRFGRDKLAEPYRGTPLLHHAILRMAEVCGETVLVLAPDAAEPPMPDAAHVRIARDPSEGGGPLAGLHAGLAAVRTDLALVAGGDMPDLRPGVLREMIGLVDGVRADAVALQDGARYRPLPCVVRAGRAAELAAELLGTGRRRLRDLLEAMPVAVMAESTWHPLDPDRRTLFDVDDPTDLSN